MKHNTTRGSRGHRCRDGLTKQKTTDILEGLSADDDECVVTGQV